MKGALVFLAVFVLLTLVTIGSPQIPPGRLIYDALGVPETEYPVLGIPVTTLSIAVFNGIVYGFIAWLIYSLTFGRGSRQKEPPKEAPRAAQPA